jgi:DMSO/TMAO reductase YedYZ molybdopterin-dependent catalytic subunit
MGRSPFIADETITRRTVLEWLGKATVVTLGADLLAACAAHTTRVPDGAVDAPALPLLDGVGDPAFRPGVSDATVFREWGERTVDPQDLPSILARWDLVVDGMVESSRRFSFAGLVGLPAQRQVTDFHCVEGWSVYDVPWSGVHLSQLLTLVTPLAAATHVTFHTIGDTYNESLPLAVALEPRTLLAYGVAGATLPLSHGFPLRVVVPRLLGYKNAKYVYRLELTDHPVSGYWVAAGYPYDGEVPSGRLRPGRY